MATTRPRLVVASTNPRSDTLKVLVCCSPLKCSPRIAQACIATVQFFVHCIIPVLAVPLCPTAVLDTPTGKGARQAGTMHQLVSGTSSRCSQPVFRATTSQHVQPACATTNTTQVCQPRLHHADRLATVQDALASPGVVLAMPEPSTRHHAPIRDAMPLAPVRSINKAKKVPCSPVCSSMPMTSTHNM